MLVIVLAAGTTFNMLFASTNIVQTGTAVNMWTVIIRSNHSAIVRTCILFAEWYAWQIWYCDLGPSGKLAWLWLRGSELS